MKVDYMDEQMDKFYDLAANPVGEKGLNAK
jgi:hypothetical protein